MKPSGHSPSTYQIPSNPKNLNIFLGFIKVLGMMIDESALSYIKITFAES